MSATRTSDLEALAASPDVDPETLMGRCMAWAGGHRGDSLANHVELMRLLAARLSPDQLARVCTYGPFPLKDATTWVFLAGGLTPTSWGPLIANRLAVECLEVFDDDATWSMVRQMTTNDPSRIFPALTEDPGAFQKGLERRPDWLGWIALVAGPERVSEVVAHLDEYEADRQLRDSLRGTAEALYWATANAPQTERHLRRLHNWAVISDTDEEALGLFEACFSWDLRTAGEGQDVAPGEAAPEGPTWDKAAVLRVWHLAATTPPDQMIASFHIERKAGGDGTGMAHGTEGFEMSWKDLGAVDAYDQSGEGDVKAGLNQFDATYRHELGHTVAEQNGFDRPGGFVFDRIGWERRPWSEVYETVFKPAFPLPADLTEDERAAIDTALGWLSDFGYGEMRTAVRDRTQALQLLQGISLDPDDLLAKAEATELFQVIKRRSAGHPWESFEDVGGRVYHPDWVTEGEDWVSYPADAWGRRVSFYQMKSPQEWFAEAYATFYADADQPGVPVGHMLAGVDPLAYTLFLGHVHNQGNPQAVTGQQIAGGGFGV